MSKEDDNDKFLEIKEDSYDDLDNRYYSFGDNGMGNHDSFPVFDEPDDEIQDLSEMIATLFDDFVSLLPSDVQEYAEKAVSVVLSRIGGDPHASLRLINELKKLAKNKDCPGIYLYEAEAYKHLAVLSLQSDQEEALRAIKNEHKALRNYVKYAEKQDFGNIDDYLSARIEDVRARHMLGEYKGSFVANIIMAEGTEFDIEKIIESLDEFYHSDVPPENFSENEYIFMTDSDSVVSVQYNPPLPFDDELSGILSGSELGRSFDDSMFGNGYISVTIDAGDSIYSAAIDMQQVLAAISKVYPDTGDSSLNNVPMSGEALPLLLEEAREEIFCEPVMFNIFFEEKDDRKYLATHNARAWGRRDIAIIADEFGDENDALDVLIEAMYRHMKHAIKNGDREEFSGYSLKADDFTLGLSDIIILRERKNG